VIEDSTLAQRVDPPITSPRRASALSGFDTERSEDTEIGEHHYTGQRDGRIDRILSTSAH